MNEPEPVTTAERPAITYYGDEGVITAAAQEMSAVSGRAFPDPRSLEARRRGHLIAAASELYLYAVDCLKRGAAADDAIGPLGTANPLTDAVYINVIRALCAVCGPSLEETILAGRCGRCNAAPSEQCMPAGQWRGYHWHRIAVTTGEVIR